MSSFSLLLKLILIVTLCFHTSYALSVDKKTINIDIQHLLNITKVITAQVPVRINAALNNPGLRREQDKLAYSLEISVDLLAWTWKAFVAYMQYLNNLMEQFAASSSESSNSIQNIVATFQETLKNGEEGYNILRQAGKNEVHQVATYIHSGTSSSTYIPLDLLKKYNEDISKFAKLCRLAGDGLLKASKEIDHFTNNDKSALENVNVYGILKQLSVILQAVKKTSVFISDAATAFIINDESSEFTNSDTKKIYNNLYAGMKGLIKNMEITNKFAVNQNSVVHLQNMNSDPSVVIQPASLPKYQSIPIEQWSTQTTYHERSFMPWDTPWKPIPWIPAKWSKIT